MMAFDFFVQMRGVVDVLHQMFIGEAFRDFAGIYLVGHRICALAFYTKYFTISLII